MERERERERQLGEFGGALFDIDEGLVDLAGPLQEAVAHLLDLVDAQHAGLHPGHMHRLIDSIDTAFDEAHRKRLHHQQLNLKTTHM